MATGARRGQARIRPVSRFSHAPAGQEAGRSPSETPAMIVTGQAFPLPRAGSCHPGRAWEQTYPGTGDQPGRVRAALRPLLRDCPMADDVLLIMSELAANAVRHSKSREPDGTFTARLLNLPGEYVLGEIEDGGSNWAGDLRGSARDGSGLFLVLNIAAACGVSAHRRKRLVWFCLHYPPDGHEP
jgi:serine/threonine-protein kinase RsbW